MHMHHTHTHSQLHDDTVHPSVPANTCALSTLTPITLDGSSTPITLPCITLPPAWIIRAFSSCSVARCAARGVAPVTIVREKNHVNTCEELRRARPNREVRTKSTRNEAKRDVTSANGDLYRRRRGALGWGGEASTAVRDWNVSFCSRSAVEFEGVTGKWWRKGGVCRAIHKVIK